MGLFDEYIPDPPLFCPLCQASLNGWQGKDGPCGLFVWRQGIASPIDQRVDSEIQLPPEVRAQRRLPNQFMIYTKCCGSRYFIEAECFHGKRSLDRHQTGHRRNGDAKERLSEKSDFKARLRWLSGKG